MPKLDGTDAGADTRVQQREKVRYVHVCEYGAIGNSLL